MKALILSTALLFAPALLSAQAATDSTPLPAPTHHHHSPHKAAARLGRTLGLSADQQARVEPILAARQQKADAVRANTQLSSAEQQQQLHAIRHDAHTQLGAVLTPDQMRQMKARHHAKHAADAVPVGA